MSFSNVDSAQELHTQLHEPSRELMGQITLEVYNHLARQPRRNIPGVLHGSTNRTRIRKNLLQTLTRVADDKVFGYDEVWTHGARIEAWRDGKRQCREVELQLYSSDGVRRDVAPLEDEMMKRVDWIGTDTEGAAYINFANVDDIAALDGEVEPSWKVCARADRYGLRVAAATVMAAESSWPGISIGRGGHAVRRLEQAYIELGEILEDTPRDVAATQWYAPLPNTDFLGQQVSIR